MQITIDKQIDFDHVYKVNVTVTSVKKGVKVESSIVTTFNRNQPEIAISRAINKGKLDKDSIDSAEIKMIELIGEISK